MAEEAQSYDAFISYRRSDGTAAARRLRAMLRAYRLPRALEKFGARRLNVFLDTVYERGASDFYEETIRPALMASRHLLVVATPDAVMRSQGDDWIAREIADFSAGPNGRNVIVVRAAGEFLDPLPADILQRYPHIQIVDYRNSGWLNWLMPQRAARLADERIKLVGPLFGVPLEAMPQLRREEERQQIGRWGALTGIAAALVLFAVGLSIFALRSQWQEQKALQQSLQVSEDAIFGITEQYYDDEAIDSISRDLVIANCDLSRQLAQRTNAAQIEEVTAACAIEEGVAFGIGEKDKSGPPPIETALAAADRLYFADPGLRQRLAANLRAGYRSWVLLETQADKVLEDKANAQLAAFERRFAAQRMGLADFADNADIRDEVVTAFTSARAASFAQAERLERAGHMQQARGFYRAASEDARAAFDAADKNSIEADKWNQLTWSYYSAAFGYAVLAADGEIQEAIEILDRSDATYRDAPPFEGQERRTLAARADIAMERSRLFGRMKSHDAQEATLWTCLEFAQRSLELTRALAQPNPDDDANRADAALQSCRKEVSERIDARRAEVNRLVAAGSDAEAAAQMPQVIELSRKINIYRPGDAWGELYIGIALRDLSAMLVRLGRDDDAEESRLQAADIYRPHIETIDQLNLSASQAAEARRAWDDIWRAHYNGYSDGLENAARATSGEASIALWTKVIEVDDRWDDRMPRRREWDVVYQCKLRLALAWELRALGQADRSWETFEECYRRIEPYQGQFQLAGSDLDHAKWIWSEVLKWRRENAPSGSPATPAAEQVR